jgi:multiple sugar transport system substrate-binding protein
MKKSFSLGPMKLLLAGFAAFAIFASAGCSFKGGNRPNEDTETPLEQKTRITLAVQSSAESNAIESLIEQFNAVHPGFYVEVVNLPRDRYDQMLNMRMTSGEGPDVFQIGTGWLTPYIYKNWLLDLSEAVSEQELNAFPRWAFDYTKQNKHFYAIPSGMMTLRLIYNKDLLARAGYNPENPPSDLGELKNYADKISQAGTGYQQYGFALPAGEDWAGFQQSLEMASTYSGINYYDFARGKYDFAVYKTWFQTMLDMKQQGGLFPGETSLKSDTALTQFAEGNIGMMYVTNRDFVMLGRMKPLQFAWGIAMPPLSKPSDRGKGALMIYPEPPLAINAYTNHKQEAVELWKFLHSREYLGTMYKQGGAIPTLEGITDDPQFRQLQPQFDAFLPNGEESPYPKEPKFILQNIPTLFSPKNLGDAARMKAYRDILQGLQSPAEMLNKLTLQYNNSLDDAVLKKLINLNDYVDPLFEPRNPLKKNQ